MLLNSNKKLKRKADRQGKLKRSLDGIKLRFELMPAKKYNRGNTRKYLTKDKKENTMNHVIKLKRKDDKMTKEKITKSNKRETVKSLAWLIEATFRVFVGWVMLSNFDHLVTTIAALYALGSAGIIVIAHFVNAHKQ